MEDKLASRQGADAGEQAPAPTPAQISREISDLAYRYYLERGGTHGFDFEDWLRAEEEVLRRHGLYE